MHTQTAPSGITVHSEVPLHASRRADDNLALFALLSYSLWLRKIMAAFSLTTHRR